MPRPLGGIQVRAASLTLLSLLNTGVARATGSTRAPPRSRWRCCGTARRFGHRPRRPDLRIWLGGRWFNVAGILQPRLAPDINSALIGYAPPSGTWYVSRVGAELAGPPSRSTCANRSGRAVQSRSREPPAPGTEWAKVSQPSDALTVRPPRAKGVQQPLPGLGVVSLFVGAGVASIMIISVLERRSEIGLRPGCDEAPDRTQFLGESICSPSSACRRRASRGRATAVYASSKSWAIVIPVEAWSGGIASAVLIGAFAGLMPAVQRLGCRHRGIADGLSGRSNRPLASWGSGAVSWPGRGLRPRPRGLPGSAEPVRPEPEEGGADGHHQQQREQGAEQARNRGRRMSGQCRANRGRHGPGGEGRVAGGQRPGAGAPGR